MKKMLRNTNENMTRATRLCVHGICSHLQKLRSILSLRIYIIAGFSSEKHTFYTNVRPTKEKYVLHVHVLAAYIRTYKSQ